MQHDHEACSTDRRADAYWRAGGLAALAFALLILLGWAGPARGATMLSDANSTVAFDTRDGVLQITSWTVNGVEEVGRKWYYWRTSGTSEVPISSLTQTSLTPSDTNADPGDDKLVAVYSGSGFTLTATFTLTGGTNGGLGATLAESFRTAKSGGGMLSCHLFAYDDYDLGGPGMANTLSMPNATSAVQSGGGHSLTVSYDTAATYRQTGLATDSPCILGSLCDSSKTTLTNVVGDVTGNTDGAFQWDFSLSGMSGSKTITGTNSVLTPEPATLALLACGAAAMLLRRRRRAASKSGGHSVSRPHMLAAVVILTLSTTLCAQGMGGGMGGGGMGGGGMGGGGMGGGGMGGGGMGGGGMGGGGMGGGMQKSMLGWRIFEDTSLSQPTGLACASCHSSTTGFADPRRSLPVSVGSLPTHVGNRNAPTAAYASYSPTFHLDPVTGQYVGGQFWDGRAATLADQAKGPFLNPLEHNMPNKAAVVSAVKNSMYGRMFTMVYGSSNTVEADYENIADAIAAWEASGSVNQFTSKYDRYLANTEALTTQETRGMQKFQSSCTGCHSRDATDGKQVFTDFTYRNAGVPRNPKNPFYQLPAELNPDGINFTDHGLGGVLGLAGEDGKFKTPTLRNVAVTGPYSHNGYFETLDEIVAFMANRDVEPGRWPSPEISANLDTSLGDFNFSAQDIADMTAFLGTLTDAGMVPEPATLAMLVAGSGSLLALWRRRKASVALRDGAGRPLARRAEARG